VVVVTSSFTSRVGIAFIKQTLLCGGGREEGGRREEEVGGGSQ